MPARPFVRHPWERARGAFFVDLLVRRLAPRRARTVLDVGAGDGWFSRQLLARLATAATVTCWDVGYTAEILERLAVRPDRRMSFTAERPAGRFDAILLLDVLEHVEDDRGLLAALVEDSLAPEGLVLAAVPAWPWLYTRHDVRLSHVRRYSPGRFRELLAGSGLRPLSSGGLFLSLAFVRLLAKLREVVIGDARAEVRPLEWRHGELGARVLEGILRADGLAGRLAASGGITLPGLSLWAVCRGARARTPSGPGT